MKRTHRPFAIVVFVVAILVLVMVSPAFGSADNSARVWIEYRPGNGAQVKEAITRAGAQFHHEFHSLDSFVVTMSARALDGISSNPNVISIEPDAERYLVAAAPSKVIAGLPQLLSRPTDPNDQIVPYGIDAVQARDVWDANRDGLVDPEAPTGAGRKICIIDTGLYTAHDDITEIADITGDSQVDENWESDGYGHGTHVAGTIAADNNSLGVVGVTPGTVDLHIVKIFNDAGEWVTYASDLLAAAYLCHDAGANIISMSLSGPRPMRKEERGFDQLYEAGVLSVAAASNGGADLYHYPASYDSVISVAAIDETKAVAIFSQFNDQVELSAPGVDVLSTVPFLAEAHVSVGEKDYSANHIEYAPYGEAVGELVDGGECEAAGDWQGKVVLCERSEAIREITFLEKTLTAQAGGAVAAVIYNNVEGSFFGTLGKLRGNQRDIIMAVSLSQADGMALLDNLDQKATVVSPIPTPASGYEAWSGTSMATPHVSAVAALIWSAYPDLTNVEIREALVATALDLGAPDRDVYYGCGLVQAYDALQSLSGAGE